MLHMFAMMAEFYAQYRPPKAVMGTLPYIRAAITSDARAAIPHEPSDGWKNAMRPKEAMAIADSVANARYFLPVSHIRLRNNSRASRTHGLATPLTRSFPTCRSTNEPAHGLIEAQPGTPKASLSFVAVPTAEQRSWCRSVG